MDAPVIHILLDEDGTPRTINKHVKVQMIVQKHLFAGETLPEIAAHYGLELADVHAALSYYYDNKAAMDADFERKETLLKEVGISGADLKKTILQRMKQSE
jgi:uncharacterized protein (DUF433 family)